MFTKPHTMETHSYSDGEGCNFMRSQLETGITMQQISEHVWIIPKNPDPWAVQPNVGVIILPDQTILVDAGNGPKQAQSIMRALIAMKAPPVRHVIYTHHHWDHTFGGDIYGANVIAHQRCYEHLKRQMTEPWSDEYIAERIAELPELAQGFRALANAIDSWAYFRLRLPTMTFTKNLTFHFDTITLHLEHIGGQHADDSITVHVVEDRVLFLGDCFYPPIPPQRKPDDTLDAAMLKKLLNDNISCYIDGHGEPFGEEGIYQRIEEAEKGK